VNPDGVGQVNETRALAVSLNSPSNTSPVFSAGRWAGPLHDIQAMADQEQLAGYDDQGKHRLPEERALESPPGVPAASSPELRTLVAVVVGAVVVAALYIAQDVLIPMTLAVLLSFVLSPLVDLLRRIGLWRAPAVALSVCMALGAIGSIGTLLGNQATTLAADVPHYVEVVQHRLESVQAVAAIRLAFITRLLDGGTPATAVHLGRACLI
jgi:hypothetical protein